MKQTILIIMAVMLSATATAVIDYDTFTRPDNDTYLGVSEYNHGVWEIFTAAGINNNTLKIIGPAWYPYALLPFNESNQVTVSFDSKFDGYVGEYGIEAYYYENTAYCALRCYFDELKLSAVKTVNYEVAVVDTYLPCSNNITFKNIIYWDGSANTCFYRINQTSPGEYFGEHKFNVSFESEGAGLFNQFKAGSFYPSLNGILTIDNVAICSGERWDCSASPEPVRRRTSGGGMSWDELNQVVPDEVPKEQAPNFSIAGLRVPQFLQTFFDWLKNWKWGGG